MGGPSQDLARARRSSLDMADRLVRSVSNASGTIEENIPGGMSLNEVFEPPRVHDRDQVSERTQAAEVQKVSNPPDSWITGEVSGAQTM